MCPCATEAVSGATNATVLSREIAWFARVIDTRMRQYFSAEAPAVADALPEPPDLQGESGAYADMVRALDMGADERIVVMLALMPHLRPQVLDAFMLKDPSRGQPYTEFGGWRGATRDGFQPTCETAAFILAANDLARRFTVLAMFGDSHIFEQHRLFKREAANSGLAPGARPLLLQADHVRRLTMP